MCYGWGERRVTGNFGGVDVVPSLGAIVACYGWVAVWRPTLQKWTWCHCSVLWGAGGEGEGQLWGVPVGRLTLREPTWCHCRVPMAPYTAMASRTKTCRKTALSFLQRLHLLSTLITQKLVFAIGVYAGIIFVACLRFSSHGQFRHVVSCFDLLLFKFHWILLWIQRLGAHRCDSDTLMYELSKRTMKAVCVGLRVWNKGLR